MTAEIAQLGFAPRQPKWRASWVDAYQMPFRSFKTRTVGPKRVHGQGHLPKVTSRAKWGLILFGLASLVRLLLPRLAEILGSGGMDSRNHANPCFLATCRSGS